MQTSLTPPPLESEQTMQSSFCTTMLLYRKTREARLLDSKESDETMASEQASASADPPTPPPKPSRSARTSPECPGKHPRKSMAPIARPKRGRAVSDTSTIAYASDGAWDPAEQLRSAEIEVKDYLHEHLEKRSNFSSNNQDLHLPQNVRIPSNELKNGLYPDLGVL